MALAHLRPAAAALVRAWAWHQDQALVEDVQSAGLVAQLEGREPLGAMRNEVTRWLWGVTRGQRPRRLTRSQRVNWALVSHAPGPEQVAEARIAMERLWGAAPVDERLVWYWLTEHGAGIPSAVYRGVGWNANIVHDRKRALRDRARRVLGVPTGRSPIQRRRPHVPPSFGEPDPRPVGNSMRNLDTPGAGGLT